MIAVFSEVSQLVKFLEHRHAIACSNFPNVPQKLESWPSKFSSLDKFHCFGTTRYSESAFQTCGFKTIWKICSCSNHLLEVAILVRKSYLDSLRTPEWDMQHVTHKLSTAFDIRSCICTTLRRTPLQAHARIQCIPVHALGHGVGARGFQDRRRASSEADSRCEGGLFRLH